MKDRDVRALMDELAEDKQHIVDLAVDLAENRLSPARAADVRQRLATDPAFRAVAQPVLDAYEAPPLTDEEFSRSWADFRRRAGLAESVSNDPGAEFEERVRARNTGMWRMLGKIAAVILIMFGAASTFLVYLDVRYWTTRSAGQDAYTSIHLRDGSWAQLAPGSEIRFRRNLGERPLRMVQLQKGEATFTVTGIQGATFEVQTGHARITVAGTRFTVGIRDDATTVAVEEGRLLVQPLDEQGTPGKLRLIGAGARVRVTRGGFIEDVPDAPVTPPPAPGAKP